MTPYESKTFKSRIKEESVKLKDMSFKDKTWYIWEYYKYIIIGVIVGVFMVVSIGTSIYKNRFDTAFSCVILNSKYDEETLKVDPYFNEGFRQYIGLDENSKIDVDYTMNLSFDESSMNEYNYALLAKITAMVSSKELDVMIGRSDVIDHYGEMEGYLDLEKALPADLYDLVKDNLYIVTNQETGAKVPCGIRLDGTSFGDDTGLVLKDPIFAIMSNSTRTDTCIEMIRYIFQK